ncbi:hypothetical protein GCM10022254_29690 [Actinomadura meridiana]|uniref:Uncharacterized protein n=1 Tax=Actinomadura meridiana TaxID=559626 RepID=A0ABP8C107_9ACTN
MTRRALTGVGAVVAVMALVGLGAYFAAVGLDDADKLASVLGVFVALAGLAVAVYGLVTSSSGSTGGNTTNVRMTGTAKGHGRVFMAGGDQTNNE